MGLGTMDLLSNKHIKLIIFPIYEKYLNSDSVWSVTKTSGDLFLILLNSRNKKLQGLVQKTNISYPINFDC